MEIEGGSRFSNVQIEVNGAPTQCAEHATLAQLVSNLGYGDQRIAVEHNGQIVPRDRYEQTMIAPGDTLPKGPLLDFNAPHERCGLSAG